MIISQFLQLASLKCNYFRMEKLFIEAHQKTFELFFPRELFTHLVMACGKK